MVAGMPTWEGLVEAEGGGFGCGSLKEADGTVAGERWELALRIKPRSAVIVRMRPAEPAAPSRLAEHGGYPVITTSSCTLI